MELVLNNSLTELSSKEMYNINGGATKWSVAFAAFMFGTTASWAVGRALDAGFDYCVDKLKKAGWIYFGNGYGGWCSGNGGGSW